MVGHGAALRPHLRAGDGRAARVAAALAQHAAAAARLRCRAGAALEHRAAAVADGPARGARRATGPQAATGILRYASVPTSAPTPTRHATGAASAFSSSHTTSSTTVIATWSRLTLTAHQREDHRHYDATESVPHYAPAIRASDQANIRHSATARQSEPMRTYLSHFHIHHRG